MALQAMPVIPVSEGAAPAPGLTPRPEGLRALLAGLDGSNRKEASRWLTSAGFEVVAAADAADAVEVFRGGRVDVVLADMALRGEGGRSLAQLLRPQAESGDVPMIALCSSRRDTAAALESGADDLLERPFDWRVASRRAERLVRLAEAAGQLARLQKETERLRSVLEEERQERTWLNQFDALTGLPNGERLERALESALATACDKSQVAVALFDIEHLVLINSRLGRARVNSLLQQVAQRLIAGLRSEEILNAAAGPSMSMAARIGGGLFAAMLTGLPGWPETKTTVRLLLDRISGRYFAGEEEISLTASVGVAVAPGDGLTAEAMIQKAELAASEAVETGAAIRFYGQSSHRVTERSRAITRLLPNALARGEFKLHYQPLVEDSAVRVSAAEALLRWDSAELGSVPPSEFVPLAEEAALMVGIGSWVLRTAWRQVKAWQDQGLPPTRIAVNVSLCQLVRGDLAQLVREVLAETGIDPSLLELELSERGVLRSDPEILRQLRAIRALGVRLAIDDFGTGNSAVAYLKQFPIDILKIDQSFVQGVSTSSEDAAITSATIAMARQLGLRVVAEGVEEEDQMEFLRRNGCREYQGFLFSPAVPPEVFAAMLRSGLGMGLPA
ncbi:MAG TPA: EAL domain-containing protein [Candidatus Polarisedimenticolia bacterium]|nr:EAL domain-containing protein [Candidatus Polarisedimenticolia bacterium]